MTRSAVVINPTRVVDLEERRRRIRNALADAGWEPPLWFETTRDDTGAKQTREAIDAGVEVVFACGGDGTVMACVGALAGTEVALAVLPAGTGNLLAANLGLPDDPAAGVEVAVRRGRRKIDVGVVGDRTFAVMAGMGFDAAMVAGAPEKLKRRLGWPAYAVSAAKHLRSRPMRVEVRLDDRVPLHRRARSVLKILPERPDIVVSGINHGANLGDDVTYSGTVAGALEASVFRLPGIAVSLAAREGDFTRAANFAAELTARVLKKGLPEGTILNVNVPVGEIRGARLTHQGVVSATPDIVEGVDPRGRAYYWIGIQKISWKEDRSSDYAAIGEGLVSITPLRTDMTDYRTLEALRGQDLFGFDVES
jgi:hypothetical protein